MPKQDPAKFSDPEEYKRFLETARKVEAEESLEAFDKAFSKIIRPQNRHSQKKP